MKYFLFLITLLLISVNAVLAVDSTNSATPTTDTEINNNLQDRIRNMVQQNVSTTEAKIKEKINELSLVGYAGKITAVSATSISLDSNSEMFQVVATDSTNIVSGSQKIKLSSIAIGDKIIVIGTLNSKKDIITAKRIVVVKTVVTEKPTIYIGTIEKVDTAKRTISIKTPTGSVFLILSKKANLKIDEFKTSQSALFITRPQDAGQVITKAKIL